MSFYKKSERGEIGNRWVFFSRKLAGFSGNGHGRNGVEEFRSSNSPVGKRWERFPP